MGTLGFPADAAAQERHIQIETAPSPPASASPAGPTASPPAAPHGEAKAWEAPVVTVVPVGTT